jgi:hypothetical protein
VEEPAANQSIRKIHARVLALPRIRPAFSENISGISENETNTNGVEAPIPFRNRAGLSYVSGEISETA